LRGVCGSPALLKGRGLGSALYISPFQELVDQRYADWKSRLSKIDGHKEIFKLTGETSTNLKLLQRSDSGHISTMGCGFNPVATTEQRTNGRAFIADKLQMQGGGGAKWAPLRD